MHRNTAYLNFEINIFARNEDLLLQALWLSRGPLVTWVNWMVYDNSTPLLCSCCGCEICDAIKLIMKIFIEQFLLQSLKLILFLPVAFQSLSRRSWSPSAFRWQSRGSGLSWEQCQILCFSLAAIDQQDHQGSFLNRQRAIFNSLTCSWRFLWQHLYFSECRVPKIFQKQLEQMKSGAAGWMLLLCILLNLPHTTVQKCDFWSKCLMNYHQKQLL